jgi:ubiquinone/menaquinone biosynthesis C-methylase UbiE
MESDQQRRQIEQQFHDQTAHVERRDFYAWGALRTADEYAYALVGDPSGCVVLDLGCGQGAHTRWFARRGAVVHATDVSWEMVDETLRRAAAAGLEPRIRAAQMAAEALAYPDNSFDLVFGHSVIHHTEMDAALAEIARVLKPGGRAIFLEPLAHNPLIALFRRLTPWRRTPTEQPLRWQDIRQIAAPFSRCDYRVFYLAALLAFAALPLRSRGLFQALLRAGERTDRWLLRAAPALQRYAWVIVLHLTK